MKLRTFRNISNGIDYVVIAVVLLCNLNDYNLVYRTIKSVTIAIESCNFVIAFLYLRCPYCLHLLSFRWSSQGMCPHCRKPIDD